MATDEDDLNSLLDEAKISEAKEADKEVVEKEASEEPSGIELLKKQLEEERALRIEAQKNARTASEEAARAANDVHDTNLHLVNASIDTLKNDIDNMKQNYAAALSNGDFVVAADIQMEMNIAANRLVQLETGKQAMEEKPKIVPAVSKTAQEDAFIDSLSSRSAEWVRNHRETIRNPELNRKLLLAHAVAVDDGLDIDSDEYFDAIEKRLGFKKVQKEENDEDATLDAAKVVSRRSDRERSPEPAPVTRGEGKRTVVRLTSDEREMASMMGMSDEQYAEQKQNLKREGRMQ